jgi:hypothetical protein
LGDGGGRAQEYGESAGRHPALGWTRETHVLPHFDS